jgi:hypothetical protein
MDMSLEVFAPSLIKYMSDTSGKHADKILCEETVVHKFESAPIITSELWKALQDFNILRIRLAYVNIARCSVSNGSMQRTSLRTKVMMSVLSLLWRSSQSFAPLVENLLWLEPESKVSLCLPNDLSTFSSGRGVTPFGNWGTQSVSSFRSTSMSCFSKQRIGSWTRTQECMPKVF